MVVQTSALGQEAVLKYKILQKKEEYSLLEIDLITGRYHQIRTQLAAIGCPVVGDTLYGSNVASGIDKGIALHAFSLQINALFQGKKLHWISYPNPFGVWNLFFK